MRQEFQIGEEVRITRTDDFALGDLVTVSNYDPGVGLWSYWCTDGDFEAWVKPEDMAHLVTVVPPPTVPVPPKFSSPEEADAWLEKHSGGVVSDDPFTGPNMWRVQVFRPDGSLAFQAGAEIVHRSDPEDVRTMLTVAQETAHNLPF